MSFRLRLILLITGLLIAVIVLTSFALAYQTRATLLDEAERTGARVAGLLARSAVFGAQVSRETEDVVGEMMLAQARVTAAYVAAAERAGDSSADISDRLAGIAASSVIDEFWVTDAQGRAYLTNVAGADFTFSPDAALQPQAHVFWSLLEGAGAVVQNAKRRELDSRMFKYVGVPGIDGPRIVQVGIEVGFLDRLAEKMGVMAMVRALVGEGDVNAIWVLGEGLATLAHATVLGSQQSPPPNDLELLRAGEVMASGIGSSFHSAGGLTVVAPMQGDGGVVGAAIVRLSTRHLDEVLASQAWSAAWAALVALLLGSLVAVAVARRATTPLVRLGEAARAIEAGDFVGGSLAGLACRRDEFGHLASLFERMAEEVRGREEQLDAMVKERTAQLLVAHRRIDQELEVAQSFQSSLLPSGVGRGAAHEVYGFMVPACEMSGDFYDHFLLEDGRLCIVVGDVSGKGVPAALFMVLARTALQAAAAAGGGPGAMLGRLNRQLVASNPIELFVTMFLGIYDPTSGVLVYGSGGHPPPCLLRADGSVAAVPRPGGMALGVFDDVAYPEATVMLAPGDTLFLYTDGITEAFDPQDAAFGEARLDAALAEGRGLSAQALAVHVATTVDRFAKGTEQSDDITCLVLRRAPTAPELSLRMINDIDAIPAILDAVGSFCARHGVPERAATHLQLAVDEVLANIVEHAWDDAARHEVELHLSLRAGRIECVVRDDGRAFDPLQRPSPDTTAPIEERTVGGLGLHIVRRLMSNVDYRRSDAHNVLTLLMTVGTEETAGDGHG